MKKVVAMFLASLLVTVMVALTPQSVEAAILRDGGEFGANEVGQILDDFMLKRTYNPGKYYSVENRSKSAGITNYLLSKGSSSKHSKNLSVEVRPSGAIKAVSLQVFFPGGMSNSSIESLHDAWKQAVVTRYGEPTDEGHGQQYGYPYAEFQEDGKYKYRIDTYRIGGNGQPTAAGKGTVIFSVKIETI